MTIPAEARIAVLESIVARLLARLPAGERRDMLDAVNELFPFGTDGHEALVDMRETLEPMFPTASPRIEFARRAM